MTDLTDRMRTCAAHILREGIYIEGELPPVYRDAADLLIEASNALEAAAQPQYPPGVPMEVIPPVVASATMEARTADYAAWVAPGDTLPKANPYRSPRACPKCDSRANKTVYRRSNRFVLECPACGHVWERA